MFPILRPKSPFMSSVTETMMSAFRSVFPSFTTPMETTGSVSRWRENLLLTPEPDIWGHADPIQAAQFAKNAGVKKLILTHFAAHLYDTLEKRKIAEEKAREIFPNTLAATDGLAVEV